MAELPGRSTLVSVIIPSYNCGAYIARAIESIINQSFTHWELLICDDGSTDDSLSVIKKWQQKENRIKLFINEKNEGHIFTYNRLFNQAQGDYVMVQDADDWSDNRRIERQLQILQQFNVGLCLCNAIFHSKKQGDQYQPKRKSEFIDIRTEETWAPATLFFKRSILRKVSGFSDYFHRTTSMDRYFIMDALSHFGGYYLEEYLYHVWMRPDSDHRSIDVTHLASFRKIIMHDIYLHLKKQRIDTGTDYLAENNIAALRDLEAKKLNDRNYIAEKLRVFACIQIDYNNTRNAWKILLQAMRLAPFSLTNYRTLFYLLRK